MRYPKSYHSACNHLMGFDVSIFERRLAVLRPDWPPVPHIREKRELLMCNSMAYPNADPHYPRTNSVHPSREQHLVK